MWGLGLRRGAGLRHALLGGHPAQRHLLSRIRLRGRKRGAGSLAWDRGGPGVQGQHGGAGACTPPGQLRAGLAWGLAQALFGAMPVLLVLLLMRGGMLTLIKRWRGAWGC